MPCVYIPLLLFGGIYSLHNTTVGSDPLDLIVQRNNYKIDISSTNVIDRNRVEHVSIQQIRSRH